MMQAFDVACAFCEQPLKRDLIIDASVYGIGRGAGNLNTEIFAKYANTYLDKSYDLKPLVKIYDKYISNIYKKEKWGYSVPYFISAKYNCNPNFASYYEKKGIPNELIERAISTMKPDERIIFKKEVADEYYDQIMDNYFCVSQNEYENFVTRNYYSKKICLIIATANRPLVIDRMILESCGNFLDLGIDIIVYDSSNNNHTEIIVKEFSKSMPNLIYDRWQGQYDGVSIDNKIIEAYLKYSSKYEYIWITRDGLNISIEKIIDEIDKKMSLKKELIIVNDISRDINNYGTKDYNNAPLLFKEQCAHMNTLGVYIVKSDFITDVIKNVPLDEKTYGMYFPFAFFQYYLNHKINASYVVGNLWKVNIAVKRNSFWTRKILWQWAERWFTMIDKLPSIYDEYKKDVIKIQTVDFKPFSIEYLLKARYYKGVSFSLINKYKKYLPYVCETPLWIFYLICCCPSFLCKEISIKYERINSICQRKRNRKKAKFENIKRKKIYEKVGIKNVK